MSQAKTTRAFRTISEAGDELGLQPHVLRFWESKFPQIKPIKRGGGRRFYRPDDIEFLRGIKKLLHDEKHPIKDVQKLIQKKGAGRIVELGRSVEKAARDRTVAETDLLPKRIKPADKVKKKPIAFKPQVIAPPAPEPIAPEPIAREPVPAPQSIPAPRPIPEPQPDPVYVEPVTAAAVPTGPSAADRQAVNEALESLRSLKSRWSDFRKDGEAS